MQGVRRSACCQGRRAVHIALAASAAAICTLPPRAATAQPPGVVVVNRAATYRGCATFGDCYEVEWQRVAGGVPSMPHLNSYSEELRLLGGMTSRESELFPLVGGPWLVFPAHLPGGPHGGQPFGGFLLDIFPPAFSEIARPFEVSLTLAVTTGFDDPAGGFVGEQVRLALVPIPEPTAVVLLGTGLLALVAAARNGKRTSR